MPGGGNLGSRGEPDLTLKGGAGCRATCVRTGDQSSERQGDDETKASLAMRVDV